MSREFPGCHPDPSVIQGRQDRHFLTDPPAGDLTTLGTFGEEFCGIARAHTHCICLTLSGKVIPDGKEMMIVWVFALTFALNGSVPGGSGPATGQWLACRSRAAPGVE